MRYLFSLLAFLLMLGIRLNAQPMASLNDAERGKERTLRYIPDGEDFVIVNGTKKFNRALYGTHTGFRVETGDLPEFALYLPRMGGNLTFGFSSGKQFIPLNEARHIESRYRPGSRIYTINDPLLGNGYIRITVLAMSDADGMIMDIEANNIPENIYLTCRFGGAADKRFSREGDLGVDPPDSFEFKPEYCKGNKYDIFQNTFQLTFGKDKEKRLTGIFPPDAQLTIQNEHPALNVRIPLKDYETYYLAIWNPETKEELKYKQLKSCFKNAETTRAELASRIRIHTPDPYFNTLGGALSVAADGVWGGEVWMHGAVGWRMPLNGWRAAYAGDALGWHDRARTHFDAYATSQVTDVLPIYSHPAQDKELNLARAEKKWGTQMYSNGYICRNPRENNKMHHYDMNLCYIDALLWHFNWTGDLDYAQKMWPVLQRHLEWEKRNFDPDNDGLYDAYCCIWASDALQYNSGAVTHSSAYNYRANKMVARIAELIGENSEPYRVEAEKILSALNSRLWLPHKGHWAEYQDLMGHKKIHESTAVWSIYHSLDSEVDDSFQAYQSTRYIDTEIPHIPVRSKGLPDGEYATISTTNWLPYSWSINNVAFAEVMHTSLAYWQSGRNEEAFKLLKSSVLDGMYLGSSPGNFGQVSFYDAARGECYRDFGDPVGVASRAFIQGLFGILPDALNNRLLIRPGFPQDWPYASLSTPDVNLDFKRESNKDTYKIKVNLPKKVSLDLIVRAQADKILSLKVNGKNTKWKLEENSVGYPRIKIEAPIANNYDIEIIWGMTKLKLPEYQPIGAKNNNWNLNAEHINKLYDPQQLLENPAITKNNISAALKGQKGHHTLFIELLQGDMKWWHPFNIEIKEPLEASVYSPESTQLNISLKNNSEKDIEGILRVNPDNNNWSIPVSLDAGTLIDCIHIPADISVFGSNKISIEVDKHIIYETILSNWNIPLANLSDYQVVNMDNALNASVTQIFKNEYLSPRSPYTTLQVPIQGIGEWCHPKITADIDDSGVRHNTDTAGIFISNLQIPFRSSRQGNNIAFTTLWDNYPDKLTIPLGGSARHAYLLMAGTTNHMQCHFVNGVVKIRYTDDTEEVLELIPPGNWCPIEQDYFADEKAFKLNAPRPYRLHLKTGFLSNNLERDLNITGVYGRSIEGGAGILLDIPLNINKELKYLEFETFANEVIIGLMGITLQR